MSPISAPMSLQHQLKLTSQKLQKSFYQTRRFYSLHLDRLTHSKRRRNITCLIISKGRLSHFNKQRISKRTKLKPTLRFCWVKRLTSKKLSLQHQSLNSSTQTWKTQSKKLHLKLKCWEAGYFKVKNRFKSSAISYKSNWVLPRQRFWNLKWAKIEQLPKKINHLLRTSLELEF